MRSSGMGRKLVSEQNFFAAAGLMLSFVVIGCSGAPKQVGDENNFNSEFTQPSDYKWSEGSSSRPKKSPNPGEDSDLNEDQQKQMEIALRRGGEKAAHCSSVVANSPTGEGSVEVVFD